MDAAHGPGPAAGDPSSTDVSRLIVVAIALCSFAAAAIHVAVLADHLAEYWLYGAFFAVVGFAQATWAGAMLVRPFRQLLVVGAILNAAITGVWAMSRTAGVGIGPQPGLEAIGVADLVSTLLEVAVVLGAVAVVLLPQHVRINRMVAVPVAGLLASAVLFGSTLALATAVDAHDHGAHREDTASAAPPASHEHRTRDFDVLWEEATPSERAASTKLVVDTAAAVAQYQDVSVALADGFRANPNQPGRLVHYPNARNRRDDKVLDPSAPESLVYFQRADGRVQLAAALYTAGAGVAPPAPGGGITMWHSHTPGCAHPTETPGCEDAVRMYMLHVWLGPGVSDPFAENFGAARL